MVQRLALPRRPKSYSGETVAIKTGCGTVFVTVSVDADGYPIETFVHGKGGCMAVSLEALGKTASIFLRIGGDAQELVDQYRHMICPSVGWDNGTRISSCAAALGMAIKDVLDKRTAGQPAVVANTDPVAVCDHSSGVSVDHAADSDEDSMVINMDTPDAESQAALDMLKQQMAERDKLGLR